MACINLNDTESPMEIDNDLTNTTESPMEVGNDDITDVKMNGVRVETEIKVVISVCHPTIGATGFVSNVRCETSFSANVNPLRPSEAYMFQ